MFYEIALKSIKGVGDVTVRKLVHGFGNAENIFNAKKSDLHAVLGVKNKIVDEICNQTSYKVAEAELKFIEKYKIKTYFFTDEDYPKNLKSCEDAPCLLYFKGSANLNNRKIISVVGTRNATNYGKQFCQNLISTLKKHDILIVSGLAYGIDIQAHKDSINQEISTVGVLGHGLDRIYPAVHRDIAEQMILNGGLLTEFPSGTNPDKQNFPKRNRIIAGLADATIVIEAKVKGGALITAEIANSYNRDVFAVPGNVNQEYSEGCNYLIKTNRAHLLTKSEDIEYILNWKTKSKDIKPKQLQIFPNISKEEQLILKIISEYETIGFDDLQFKLSIAHSKLSMAILNLEMQEIIVALPGKFYKIL